MSKLKIKDSVDLKELEKFGFSYNGLDNGWLDVDVPEMEDSWYTYIGDGGRRGQTYYLFVNEDREIRAYTSEPDGSGTDTKVNGTLFDLIQAGLVEKVE